MGEIQASLPQDVDLQHAIAALSGDFSALHARIHSLSHTVSCSRKNITLRLHYPALRDGRATVVDLVDVICLYLTWFALPRAKIRAVQSDFRSSPADVYLLRLSRLIDEAKSLFIRAQRATNRNGEAGELLLYLLTEWILGAPQLLAKMPLKTNPQMPVYGSDGVHARYCRVTNRLLLYWGEAKIYRDVAAAIDAAAESIARALQDTQVKFELQLVERNLDSSGLDDGAKAAILKYLDPFEDKSNDRANISTCLIGFSFDEYQNLIRQSPHQVASTFEALATAKLAEIAPRIADSFDSQGLTHQTLELFIFPLPSVDEFRHQFQTKIGWSS